MSSGEDRYFRERARIEQGHTKYREKLRAEGKLFVRDRLKLLFDPGSAFQEDWLFARSNEADTPADGVVTGVGTVGGRPVCVMANDYTVKAGSWVEMAIGEKTTLEELGGALMHCKVSGCGDVLAASDEDAIALARRYLTYMPQSYRDVPSAAAAAEPKAGRSIDEIVPYDQRKYFDMYEVVDRVIDAGSWFEVKKLFAAEVIVGLARIDGRPVGIVANQPKVKGGVLMVDSSDKAARFIWLCNAFNIPLVYLSDVAGFMVGSQVEREGIIRHGAKMVFATSQATVPKISVIVRKCYGAGLYAMCGPAFEPAATLSLPQGQIAIMGPEAAVNAVYYNKIMELPESERAAYVKGKRDEFAQDVDVYKLASEMLVDDIVPGASLRAELVKRLAYAESKAHEFPQRRNGVFPV